MSEPMFAMWDDVAACVRQAVEGVLTDHDPTEGPLPKAQIEWAEETASQVVAATMLHLDGWAPSDIAAEHSHALQRKDGQ